MKWRTICLTLDAALGVTASLTLIAVISSFRNPFTSDIFARIPDQIQQGSLIIIPSIWFLARFRLALLERQN